MNQTQQNQGVQPNYNAKTGEFTTLTGKVINILNPTEDMITLQDISISLSKICRFGGHVSRFYSVAQHSVLVAALCPDFAREALLHDASEAYLGDVIKPLKLLLGAAYTSLEFNFETVISQKFGLVNNKQVHSVIKRYDLEAYELEYQALKKDNPIPLLKVMREHEMITSPWVDPYKDIAWEPSYSQMVFSAKYGELFSNE